VSNSLAGLAKAEYLQKQDQYLMNLISLFRIVMLSDLKKKAKIQVDIQSLKDGQVYCCIYDPNNQPCRKVIEGTCIVFLNPCFHHGDIQVELL